MCSGFWSCHATEQMGTCYFRLLNQTKKCSLPRLVIFLEPAPALHAWAPIPAEWCEPEGCVHLCLGLGTLVPSRSLSAAKIAAGRLGSRAHFCRQVAAKAAVGARELPDEQLPHHLHAGGDAGRVIGERLR